MGLRHRGNQAGIEMLWNSGGKEEEMQRGDTSRISSSIVVGSVSSLDSEMDEPAALVRNRREFSLASTTSLCFILRHSCVKLFLIPPLSSTAFFSECLGGQESHRKWQRSKDSGDN